MRKSGVDLRFLGTGSAFCLDNYQSNMLIECNDKRLMIDCGGDARRALQGLTYKDIDAIYVSHLHNDHTGGIECMAFSSYFDPTKKPIKLIGETKLIDELWDTVLRGGLASIQGKRVGIDDYFDVIRVPRNNSFIWEGITFNIVQVCHVVDAYAIVSSYGLMFKGNKGKNIFITTDTQYAPSQLQTFYEQNDIIFQDCETAPFKSGVHAHYSELKNLSKDVKKKMYLYHYQDGAKADCKKDGFGGWCEKGQLFEL